MAKIVKAAKAVKGVQAKGSRTVKEVKRGGKKTAAKKAVAKKVGVSVKKVVTAKSTVVRTLTDEGRERIRQAQLKRWKATKKALKAVKNRA